MSIPIQLLRPLSLFQGLSDKELTLLTYHVSVFEMTIGDDLFEEGDVALNCLVLVDGQVSVYVTRDGQRERVATLKDGAPIGHMALIDRKRRSATCTVTSARASILKLGHDAFDQLFSAQTPLAYKILENLIVDLVSRLRQTNQRLVEATRERNEAKIRRKTRAAAATLMGQDKADTDQFDPEGIDVDSVEVYIPSLEQRMRERRNK